jgi:hypothetical protein
MMRSSIGFVAAVLMLAGCSEVKKSKTWESTQKIEEIMKGARAYHAETSRIPEPGVGPTPPLGACCAEGKNGKCAPNAAQWSNPTWDALRFAVDDPHYFSYEYRIERQGEKATITALAYGDLDCDGVYSTFALEATVEGGRFGAGSMMRTRELE